MEDRWGFEGRFQYSIFIFYTLSMTNNGKYVLYISIDAKINYYEIEESAIPVFVAGSDSQQTTPLRDLVAV